MKDRGEYAKITLIVEPVMNGGFIVRDQPAERGYMSTVMLAFTDRDDLLKFLTSEYSAELQGASPPPNPHSEKVE